MTGGECYEIKCQGKKVFFVSKGVTYECKKAGEKIQLDEEYKHPNHYTTFFATLWKNDFEPYEVLLKYKISRTVICPAYCEVCDEQDSNECCGSSTLSLILAFVLIFAFNAIF
ncbi:unnamed protein product [Caenorhabditis auriculariae]|uniref:Uncharacterized protein n=1 Tax=Caenorhabditis auriculariae TaxID=2777116 RepID=A0A8S1HVT0_9PELO|nr:unnamed protein product [Caenorhabditis auriculariae]